MDNKPQERGRAWIEIDLNALENNLEDIRRIIPQNCEIMAVVKANAYGHGVEGISRHLAAKGIKSFAVATVSEGVQLRQYVPQAEIIILGCTHPGDAKFLYDNNLTQLVPDGAYAKALNDTQYKMKIHIAIDTGMHRLGIDSSNYDEVESIFNLKNLTVEGTATHLASPDSTDKGEIEFTHKQLDLFNELVKKLKAQGLNAGKLHTRSSYGIYNYPELQSDYVRPGIMLYGIKSQNDETKVLANLRPVLSLKAIIAQVKWIEAGESVSYSRAFTAEKRIKTATVCIGYADGFPRHASGKGAKAIVNGCVVPIIGKICMDMLILDVTDAKDTQAGDIATLIGKDGNEEIRCEDLAEIAGTITNDILAGLSDRLPRVNIMERL
ncbi:MAG: serine racemase VanT catalytic subunit [Oscillospiraceae bacterium]|nr:serine racemase VanT catalytic subunit [Oscillospiraceae bacterium]